MVKIYYKCVSIRKMEQNIFMFLAYKNYEFLITTKATNYQKNKILYNRQI